MDASEMETLRAEIRRLRTEMSLLRIELEQTRRRAVEAVRHHLLWHGDYCACDTPTGEDCPVYAVLSWEREL